MALRAERFPLKHVRLLDGPFKPGQDLAIAYLLELEPDRFLANFRIQAGLKPKAKHYGSWESQGVSGHCGGHYISGCALAYAATGDARLLERVSYMVDELAECQAANGNGYVAAIPGATGGCSTPPPRHGVTRDCAISRVMAGTASVSPCLIFLKA